MGRDVVSDMKDEWLKAVPKIITIAEEEKEDNLCMSRFLAHHDLDEEITSMK